MRLMRAARASLLPFGAPKRKAATVKALPHIDQPFEEETVPDYDPRHFCKVAPGDVVGDGRYSIISKLGWGRFSTVWLAEDLRRQFWQSQKLLAIKFNNCDVDEDSIREERALLQRLSTADPTHRGFQVVRKIVDSFELRSSNSTYLCLVHKPLRETLDRYRWRFADGRLPVPLLKVYAKILLVGLDYLHTSCNIIHTDLKPDNILISFEDESILYDRAQELQHSEHLFKETSHRRVFQSYGEFGPLKSYLSAPMIADFGLAQHVDGGAQPIQPDPYRAPEVLLGWGWSSSADIWNMGNLIWTLASGVDLFSPVRLNPQGRYHAMDHLAHMCSILGPPSPTLVRQRSQHKWKWSPAIENQHGELCEDASSFYGGPFFSSTSGKLLHVDTVPPRQSLHDLASFMDDKDKAGFVNFLSKMLTWDPTERLNAEALANHPWLNLAA